MYIKKHIALSFENSAEITDFYRSMHIDYPKFFKMDNLSKLGFLASEILFKDNGDRFSPKENIAVICFNRSSSLDADIQYQTTIQSNENYFPSPSLFVYTLPNIVAGEIAIRNNIFGETSFYICRKFDAKQIVRTVRNVFYDKTTTASLVMWVEHFDVFMALVENVERGDIEFNVNNLDILYNKKV